MVHEFVVQVAVRIFCNQFKSLPDEHRVIQIIRQEVSLYFYDGLDQLSYISRNYFQGSLIKGGKKFFYNIIKVLVGDASDVFLANNIVGFSNPDIISFQFQPDDFFKVVRILPEF